VFRRAGRLAVVTVATLLLTALAAAPALAKEEPVGPPGPDLGLGWLLLIFVGVPLGLALVLALLIYGPSAAGRPRYRPGVREWDHAPIWVGGPEDAQTVLTRTPGDAVIEARGGGAGAGW
jgi:hypothetical protein